MARSCQQEWRGIDAVCLVLLALPGGPPPAGWRSFPRSSGSTSTTNKANNAAERSQQKHNTQLTTESPLKRTQTPRRRRGRKHGGGALWRHLTRLWSARAASIFDRMARTPLLFSLVASCGAFAPAPLVRQDFASSSSGSSTRLHFFEGLDKAFEDAGPLGKGITVGKVQVALSVSGAERTASDSIFAVLERHARESDDDVGSSYDDDYEDGYGDSQLSKMCHEICLALLRKSDSWISAASDSTWFKEQDMGKAESVYNLWADREACKFEKEHIPPEGSVVDGAPTVAVVSLIIEIQGDETNFERAGYSLAETKSVLTSIASDCRVEGGDCLNAFEVFWTPSEPTEVLTERDTIVDFPELITL